MKIPKRFKLLGSTIEVVYNPDLVKHRNYLGLASYDRELIELAPPCAVNEITEAAMGLTFCHELAHHLLFKAKGTVNWDLKTLESVHSHEEFVELLGACIHQYLLTAEYE